MNIGALLNAFVPSFTIHLHDTYLFCTPGCQAYLCRSFSCTSEKLPTGVRVSSVPDPHSAQIPHEIPPRNHGSPARSSLRLLEIIQTTQAISTTSMHSLMLKTTVHFRETMKPRGSVSSAEYNSEYSHPLDNKSKWTWLIHNIRTMLHSGSLGLIDC